MTLFVDTSAWYAAADSSDRSNARAREVLSTREQLITTDHVLLETWLLLLHRLSREAAERFWGGLRSGVAAIEPVLLTDLDEAWEMGRSFPDQDFSSAD